MITEEDWGKMVPDKTILLDSCDEPYKFIGFDLGFDLGFVVLKVHTEVKGKPSEYIGLWKDYVISTWTIREEWKNITNECTFSNTGMIIYNGCLIWEKHPSFKNYKFGPGLQVWKRQV